MKTTRIATLVAASSMVVGAVGLAAPAYADLLDGTYHRVGDGPPGSVFADKTVVITSCGAGCKNLAGSNNSDEVVQLHLQGNSWSGTDSSHDVLTIDNNSLTGTETSPFLKDTIHYQYDKVG